MVEHQRQQRLHARHTAGAGGIGLGLFLQRMRRMVGTDHVGHALVQPMPQAVAVRAGADRRVHLRMGAQPRIGFLARQRQVLRRDFAGGNVLVLSQQLKFGGGGDVEHMDAAPRFPRQPQDPAGRDHRAFVVPPHRMRTRVARHPLASAGVHAILVLGMDRHAAVAGAQDAEQIGVVVDQKVAGRRSHEDLHARRAGKPFEFGQLLGIGRGCPDVECVVAPHAVLCTGELVRDRLGTVGVRVGVRHLEHRGHPAQHRRAAAALQVLLVDEAGLAEMHLGVDDTRQHVEARAVDHCARGALAADLRYATVAYPDVLCGRAAGQVNGAACQFEVKACHGRPFRLLCCLPTLPA